MPRLIDAPARVTAVGNKPKLIHEYVGRVRSHDDALSIAHMRSPSGWTEPYQCPDFDEHTLVLAGMLRVEHDGGAIEVRPGQAVVVKSGERVRYSTPGADGAEYVAVCVPAFTPDRAKRE